MEVKQTIKFGNKLKILRKNQYLSQEDLAELSKLDRKYISNLERDASSPTLDTLYKLAAALSTKPSELVKETEAVQENVQYLNESTREAQEIKTNQKNKR